MKAFLFTYRFKETECLVISYVNPHEHYNLWVLTTEGSVFKRGKATPFLGSFHGSDLVEFYSSSSTPDFQGTDALVNFANTGNPNEGAKNNISSLIFWPMYSSNVNEPPLLTFSDPNVLSITTDTFRIEPINAMIDLSRRFPWNAEERQGLHFVQLICSIYTGHRISWLHGMILDNYT